MSCNPKQNLIQNIFRIFSRFSEKNEENPEGFCQTRVSWPILAYMCFALFRFLYLSVPVNNFLVMSGRSHRTFGITNRLLLGGKCILLKGTTRRPEWELNPVLSLDGVRSSRTRPSLCSFFFIGYTPDRRQSRTISLLQKNR